MKSLFLSLVLQIALFYGAFGQIFTNNITISGLPVSNGIPLEVFDFNNDGWEDLVLNENGYLKVYKNNGKASFIDYTTSLGLTNIQVIDKSESSSVVVCFDYDNDGWKDLAVLIDNRIYIYKNSFGGIFVDNTSYLSITNPILNTTNILSFGTLSDYDKDGDLDMYISRILSNNSRVVTLLKNNGNNFTLVDLFSTSISNSNAEPVQLRTIDYDNDQDDDLVFINKTPKASYAASTGYFSFQDIHLYSNTNGILSQVNNSGLTEAFARNGATVWDYNNDGKLDLLFGADDGYTTSEYNVKFFQNNGSAFQEISNNKPLALYPIGSSNYFWYTNSIDIDNDGDFDVYQGAGWANGSNQVWLNQNGNFIESANSLGFSGINNNYVGDGRAAWFDVDNDGDLDAYISSTTGNESLMINNTSITNNYLKISLMGCSSNYDGVGSRVVVKTDNKYLTAYYGYGIGSNTKTSDIFHFGLNSFDVADSIYVYWPSGTITKLANIKSNQHLKLIENPQGQCRSCVTSSTTYSTITQIKYDTVKVQVTDTLYIQRLSTNTLPSNFGLTKIYPNPAKDFLIIENTNTTGEYKMEIVNALGTIVFSANLTSPTSTVSLNALGANGVYIIKIYNNTNTLLETKKLVLE